jgi:hypothetical protein
VEDGTGSVVGGGEGVRSLLILGDVPVVLMLLISIAVFLVF